MLWVVSVFVAARLVSAQTRPLLLQRGNSGQEAAPVISGQDIGFRLEGWNGNARTGTWVVRINGQWVEAQSAIKTVPVTTR
jgi:hypothetical protein